MEGIIYWVKNISNHHVYIGSTKNFKVRKRQHVRLLKNGDHHSNYLQNAWNKYREDSFVFEILHKCDGENIFPEEQKFIDAFKPEYNMNLRASGGHQINLSLKEARSIREEYSVSGETIGNLAKRYKVGRATISKVVKNTIFEDSKYVPLEPNSCARRINWDIVEEMRNIERFISLKKHSEKYNISITTIAKIMLNEVWYDPAYSNEKYKVNQSGETSHSSVLTNEEVKEIRKLYSMDNISQRELGERYAVERSCIQKIIDNKTWYDGSYTPHKRVGNPRGKKKTGRKLELEDRQKIRKMFKTEKYTKTSLALLYNVSQATIRRILVERVS